MIGQTLVFEDVDYVLVKEESVVQSALKTLAHQQKQGSKNGNL